MPVTAVLEIVKTLLQIWLLEMQREPAEVTIARAERRDKVMDWLMGLVKHND